MGRNMVTHKHTGVTYNKVRPELNMDDAIRKDAQVDIFLHNKKLQIPNQQKRFIKAMGSKNRPDIKEHKTQVESLLEEINKMK
jgi:hypothetical protein